MTNEHVNIYSGREIRKMENYIVINEKKAELTEEQLEKLGIKTETNKCNKYKEMFEPLPSECYYFIEATGGVNIYPDRQDNLDTNLYNVGNYCKDGTLMKQRALHETLNRLLWKASVIAGESDNPWNSHPCHYYIFFDTQRGYFDVNYSYFASIQGVCYFPTEESAKDAIENIIRPFMKEHPDFVW